MNELEEFLDEMKLTHGRMRQDQWDRYQKSILSVENFLNLDREEEYTRRMFLLLKAIAAIEAILKEKK